MSCELLIATNADGEHGLVFCSRQPELLNSIKCNTTN